MNTYHLLTHIHLMVILPVNQLLIIRPGTHERLCRAILQYDRVAWQNLLCVRRSCTAALQSVHKGDSAACLCRTAKSHDKIASVFLAVIPSKEDVGPCTCLVPHLEVFQTWLIFSIFLTWLQVPFYHPAGMP